MDQYAAVLRNITAWPVFVPETVKENNTRSLKNGSIRCKFYKKAILVTLADKRLQKCSRFLTSTNQNQTAVRQTRELIRTMNLKLDLKPFNTNSLVLHGISRV